MLTLTPHGVYDLVIISCPFISNCQLLLVTTTSKCLIMKWFSGPRTLLNNLIARVSQGHWRLMVRHIGEWHTPYEFANVSPPCSSTKARCCLDISQSAPAVGKSMQARARCIRLPHPPREWVTEPVLGFPIIVHFYTALLCVSVFASLNRNWAAMLFIPFGFYRLFMRAACVEGK